MEKILVQRLTEPATQSSTATLISTAIANQLRSARGECSFVLLRPASPDGVDVSFLGSLDTAAVVVDVEVEVPPIVQAEFDYVVTVRPGDPAYQPFERCRSCGFECGRAPRGQYVSCACGNGVPTATRKLGEMLARFTMCRPSPV